jgi:hypothetical protein
MRVDMSKTLPAPRPHLAIPFVVLGVAGSLMAVDFFRIGSFGSDVSLKRTLLFLVPIFSLVVAFLVQPATRWPRFGKALLAATASVLSAGLVAGALIGVLVWSQWGLGEGAMSGFWCGVAFLPGFAAVLAAVRRVGRARPGSIVDRADRRAVWLAVVTTIALGTIAALPAWNVMPPVYYYSPYPETSQVLGFGALAVLVALLLGDTVGLARALRAGRQLETMRPCHPDDPALIWSPRQLDLGIGDEAAAAVIAGPGLYRDRDRMTHVVRGNAVAARGALLGSVALSIIALSISAACVITTSSPVPGSVTISIATNEMRAPASISVAR